MRKRLLQFLLPLLGLLCFAAAAVLGVVWLRQAVPAVWEPKEKPAPDPQIVHPLSETIPRLAGIPWLRSVRNGIHARIGGLSRATTPWTKSVQRVPHNLELYYAICPWKLDPRQEMPPRLARAVTLPLARSAWRGTETDQVRQQLDLVLAKHPAYAKLLVPAVCPWRSPLTDPPRVDLPLATTGWRSGH